MYVRTIQRRNKDGSVVRYLQLAHNVREPGRQPVAKVIHSFGREDQLDREALARLVRSISRFLEPGEALAAQAPEELRFLRSRPMGGAWVLDQLWRRLGVGQALLRVATRRRVAPAVERLLFALVANRALKPMSKLAALEWARSDAWLPGIGELGSDPQIFYRAMDFLLDCDEEVQREVFFAVADLLNLEVDLILFDTTSTYFEIEAEREDSLRCFGHSKDHRPDLPQVVGVSEEPCRHERSGASCPRRARTAGSSWRKSSGSRRRLAQRARRASAARRRRPGRRALPRCRGCRAAGCSSGPGFRMS
jgi:hypothetical protein